MDHLEPFHGTTVENQCSELILDNFKVLKQIYFCPIQRIIQIELSKRENNSTKKL